MTQKLFFVVLKHFLVHIASALKDFLKHENVQAKDVGSSMESFLRSDTS